MPCDDSADGVDGWGLGSELMRIHGGFCLHCFFFFSGFRVEMLRV